MKLGSARGLPRKFIEVYHAASLEPGALQAAASAGWGASFKALDGYKPVRKAELDDFAADSLSLGIPLELWGYHYLRDVAEAAMEGAAAGAMAAGYGAATYTADAEKEWAGTEGEPATLNPEAAALAFIRAFRLAAPGVLLVWQGYSAPKTGDGRPLTTDRVLQAVDAWSPMMYGTLDSTIATKTRDRAKRAAGLGVRFWPLWPSGRTDANGEQWGSVALFGQLAAELQLERSGHWYGSGSAPMLTEGQAGEPPLLTLPA